MKITTEDYIKDLNEQRLNLISELENHGISSKQSEKYNSLIKKISLIPRIKTGVISALDSNSSTLSISNVNFIPEKFILYSPTAQSKVVNSDDTNRYIVSLIIDEASDTYKIIGGHRWWNTKLTTPQTSGGIFRVKLNLITTITNNTLIVDVSKITGVTLLFSAGYDFNYILIEKI